MRFARFLATKRELWMSRRRVVRGVLTLVKKRERNDERTGSRFVYRRRL